MGPAVVVLVHVGRDEPAQLTEARVLAEVEAVVLQVSESALYEDVVGPAGLAIHALGDPVARQALHVLVGGVGAALVAVADRGRPVLLEGPLHAGDALWIGNTYLDDSGRDSPASPNSTGDM